MTNPYRDPDPRGVLNADERRTAETIADFSTPLLDITTPMSPLQVIFDVAAYLRDGNSEVEMFEMIRKLRAACE